MVKEEGNVQEKERSEREGEAGWNDKGTEGRGKVEWEENAKKNGKRKGKSSEGSKIDKRGRRVIGRGREEYV